MNKADENNHSRSAVWMGAICALIVSVTLFTPVFKVSHIKANLNNFVTTEDLMAFSDLKEKKTILPLLNTGELEKKMVKHPYIKSIDIKKQWPNTLLFKIDYRVDRFAIFDSGFYIILDQDLHVLRVDKLFYDATLLKGFSYEEFKIGEKIAVNEPTVLVNAVNLNQLMKKSHIEFLNKMDYQDGNIILYTKNGVAGNFGRADHISKKFNNFVNIYDNLIGKGIKKGLIDVSTDGLPTYKPFGY